MRFYQLGEYIVLKRENWITTDLESNFGFNILDPFSIDEFV
jgi:hypothetical protein